MDGEQRRHTATLLELAAHEVPRTLRRDQHDIEVLTRLDLLEMHIEAVREQQRRTLADVPEHGLVQVLLGKVRRQHRDEGCALDRIDRLGDRKLVLLRLLEAVALADADHDVITAVAQVQRMSASLAAVSEHADARALQRLLVNVLARKHLHVPTP